ncbi:MAG: EamA family transporter [Alphaproteobacteria bacterium]|nr:EamA family transporter [Alphaproteobacteria bacterium]
MSARQLIVLLGVSLVWGFHFVVVKTAVAATPPIFYAALRMTLVAILLSPFLRWRAGAMARLAAAGLCLAGLNYALLFTGLKYAPASASAVALELYTPFATLLSVVLLGEKVGWRRMLGVALAFSGVAVIALGRKGAGAGGVPASLGVGLVACAALTEALGAILVVKTKGLKPHQLLSWYAVFGAAALWASTALFEHGQFRSLKDGAPALVAGAVVYSALFASIFAHTAYYWLLQRLPVSQVAPSVLLTTVFAVTFGVALLGEPLTARFLIGGALALTGVAVILLRTPKGRIIEPGAPEPVVADAQAERAH